MSFLLYDITFLVIVGLLGGIFLFKRRKKLKRELGIFVLYRTQLGVRFINHISNKYKKTLLSFKYIIITVSYLLMIIVVYYLGSTVYRYVKYPILTEVIKAPPVMLLFPYFPQVFGVSSFLPPFYFAYFIIAFAVVATVHEFAHGIFMGYNKIRIKSTGVGFLGPLPVGAFVEQNEKDMEKAKKTDQMSILGAGVCANVIFAIIFLLIWWALFSITFVPNGAVFGSYSSSFVNISSISMIGGISFNNPTNQEIMDVVNTTDLITDLTLDSNGEKINLIKIIADEGSFYMSQDILIKQLETGKSYLILYNDFSAIKAGLKGTIIEINGEEIETFKELSEVMRNKKPGEELKVKTRYEEEILEYNLILGEDPAQEGRAIMGISSINFFDIGTLRIDEVTANYFFREPNTDYKVRSEFLLFLYYLVFWIFGLNVVVAFANMLPFFIFDGGRFFYLTVWGITKNEKVGRAAYKWIGILIIFSLLLLMLTWLVRVI